MVAKDEAVDAGDGPSAARAGWTFAVLVGHFLMVAFGAVLTMAMAMGAASCGYSPCGNQDLIKPALFIGIFGAGALLLVDAVGSVVLIAKGRDSLTFAWACCAGHVLLIVLALTMFGLAGPQG